MKLLLLSNSGSPDGSFLIHALDLIRTLAGGCTRALFVPFAGVTFSWDDYTAKVQAALDPTGLKLFGAHTADSDAIGRAELIVVGGGNTFQLLKECRRRGMLEAIRASVRTGTPYVGWSAGANLASPTICTTNDMPIVDPNGFEALGLVGFQINPHYTNALPAGHEGETRNQRIDEYLVANPQATVVGLPEGDWLEVNDDTTTFGGLQTGYMFCHGETPQELHQGQIVHIP
jgi:dipeptidase E